VRIYSRTRAAALPTDRPIRDARVPQAIALSARHTLPAVYFVLKGEKTADLPVQAATKYQLAININTAKSLVSSRRS
jgi:hypothetical protein